MTRTPKSSKQNMRDKHAGNACPTETVTFQRQKVDPDNAPSPPLLLHTEGERSYTRTHIVRLGLIDSSLSERAFIPIPLYCFALSSIDSSPSYPIVPAIANSMVFAFTMTRSHKCQTHRLNAELHS